MVDILHRVGIKSSSVGDVYAALTTVDGLAGWWTSDTDGDPNIGGTLQFRFGEGNRPTHADDPALADKASEPGCLDEADVVVNRHGIRGPSGHPEQRRSMRIIKHRADDAALDEALRIGELLICSEADLDQPGLGIDVPQCPAKKL